MPLQPHIGQPSPAPLTWPQRLDLARDEAEVIGIARDFLAMFTPYELDSLPKPCQPPLKLVDREDIAAYAYDVVRHDCDDNPEVAEIVHKLAHFFSHASMRMAQLSTRVQLEHGRRYSA
jgi:hypothetical protein